MNIKIFVTVGSTYPLDRLIKELDKLGTNKKYEIFAQIGKSKYFPKNIKFEELLTYDQMQEKIKWADIIISHAGAGSIIDLIASGKKFILFPRLKKYDEAVDDHQIEICKAFEKKYRIKWTQNEKNISTLTNSLKPIRKNKKSILSEEITKLI